MIRFTLILPLLMSACAEFPSIDAAQPAELGQRPDYMTAEERALVDDFQALAPPSLTDDLGADLRARADALRAR